MDCNKSVNRFKIADTEINTSTPPDIMHNLQDDSTSIILIHTMTLLFSKNTTYNSNVKNDFQQWTDHVAINNDYHNDVR